MTTPGDLFDNSTAEDDPYWDRLPYAHPYWKQFNMEEIPDKYHYGIATWMTFFGISGVLGNFLVIWIFCK